MVLEPAELVLSIPGWLAVFGLIFIFLAYLYDTRRYGMMACAGANFTMAWILGKFPKQELL